MKSRRKFTAEFKSKVVLEALQERESITELAKKYSLNVEQINKWKREFKAKAALIFTSDLQTKDELAEKEKQRLYETIGQQKVEIDFLKKALS
ncbi:MAG: transposase [Bacteroidales bacterium]